MGLDLSSVTLGKAETFVEFMGETAKVTYNPLILTADRLMKMDEPTDDGSPDAGFLAFFSELVLDWDVKKGGKKVPLTPKALGGVPLVLLRTIFTHVMREAGSGEVARPSSDG